MKKVLEGLKNGDWKTRLYIIGTTLLMLAGVGGIVVSFMINSMWLFLAGVAAGIAAVVIAQRFTIITEELETEEAPETVEEQPAAERVPEPEKAHPEQPVKKKEAEPVRAEADVTEKKPEYEEADMPEKKPARAEALDAYDQKKLKQVFYKYKVKRDHKCIIIDSWKQHQILQAPAYIWISHRKVHFLVMEKETREIEVPRTELMTLLYHPGVVCQTKEEYPQFRKETMMSKIFSKYLPSYRSGNRNGKPVIYKNLFELGHGLYLTNTSARVVLDMLQPVFQVDDQVTRDVRCQEVVKDIYKLGILLRNLVYTAKEYKDLVDDKIQTLASTGISEAEYTEILQMLFRMNLITAEYMEYYKRYRAGRQK